jgi:putative aldouronate transport system substrate-binding protein
MEYVPIPPLEGPSGLRQNPTTNNVVRSGIFLITRNNPNPAASFRLADLMLSEEASHRSVEGRLGIDWDWTEPGEAVSIAGGDAKYKVLNRLNNDNNIGWGQSMPSYRPASFREGEGDTPDQPHEGMLHRWSKENYAPYDVDKTFPPLIISSELAQELSELRATIYSIVDESFAAFVTGQMNIDQDWEAYLAQLNDAGLERMLEIYQDAYDAKYK